jgi:hypothetical protein
MEANVLCVETKAGKAGKPLAMHSRKYRHLRVHVVMDLDPGLLVGWPQNPADVLHHSAFERDGKRQKQRVERGTVEPLSEKAARRHKDETATGSRSSQLSEDSGSILRSHSSLEHQRGDVESAKLCDKRGHVLGPLG